MFINPFHPLGTVVKLETTPFTDASKVCGVCRTSTNNKLCPITPILKQYLEEVFNCKYETALKYCKICIECMNFVRRAERFRIKAIECDNLFTLERSKLQNGMKSLETKNECDSDVELSTDPIEPLLVFETWPTILGPIYTTDSDTASASSVGTEGALYEPVSNKNSKQQKVVPKKVKKVHPQQRRDGLWECCDIPFHTYREFTYHRSTRHPKSKKVVKRRAPKKEFHEQNLYEKLLKVTRMWECCGVIFKHKPSYDRHKARKHAKVSKDGIGMKL